MEILGLVEVPVFWLLIILTAAVFYIYLTWNYDFFVKRGIPGPKPTLFVGNTVGLKFFNDFPEWRRKYGKLAGFFLAREPAFIISDLDYLKEVFVKSFNTFRNRRKLNFVPYPFNLGVFFLEDDAWKRVRNIITPTFSSGKLKKMCGAISECAAILTKNFSATSGKSDVDVKEYFGAFTMDVISRTAFGIKVDSQTDFSNPFVANAKKFFQPPRTAGNFQIIMQTLAGVFPFLNPLLVKLGLHVNKKAIMFFSDSITEMIEQRRLDSKDTKESQTDFLQLMMDAEIQDTHEEVNRVPLHTQKRLTTVELVAQGVLFFFAGYETTASTLQYIAYLLAKHPDVQNKVHREIMEVIGNEDPTYENTSKLKHMENVINETLRLFPPIRILHRRAAENITIDKVTIPKGFTVFIPVFALQRDPEFFHHPDEFIPERHDEDNNPVSLLGFGHGPRNCIGKRLALVEMKIALVHLLRSIKFETGPQTPGNDEKDDDVDHIDLNKGVDENDSIDGEVENNDKHETYDGIDDYGNETLNSGNNEDG